MVKKRLRKVYGVSLSEMHMCVHKQWTMGHYLNAVLRKTHHIYEQLCHVVHLKSALLPNETDPLLC